MLDYLSTLQRGLTGEAAFTEAFDIAPVELQREVQRYLERGRIPRIDFPLESFVWSDEVRSGTPRAAEVADRLAFLTLRFEPARARALLGEVLPDMAEDDPLRGRILAAVAVSYQLERNFDAGYAAGARALAAAPRDPTPHLALADLISDWCASASPPADCPGRLAEAESLYTDGLRLAPDDPELRLGLARLHSALGVEPVRAFATLAELARRHPRSVHLQLETGRSAIAAGRRDAAEPFLLRTLNLSHDEALHEEARALLQDAKGAEQISE